MKTMLRSNENTTFGANPFHSCTSLVNIKFSDEKDKLGASVIGKNIDFHWSPLNKASITKIIEHLSDTANGTTLSLKQSAVESEFETSEWNEMVASKSNWTISLS